MNLLKKYFLSLLCARYFFRVVHTDSRVANVLSFHMRVQSHFIACQCSPLGPYTVLSLGIGFLKLFSKHSSLTSLSIPGLQLLV